MAKRKKQPTNADLVAKAGEALQTLTSLRSKLHAAARADDFETLTKLAKALTDALKSME